MRKLAAFHGQHGRVASVHAPYMNHTWSLNDPPPRPTHVHGIRRRYTWHTLDRQRFTSAKGVGWENHFPAGSRANEVIDILALRSAVKQCSLLVGSQSQFGISLWKGMMAHKDAPFVRAIPVLFLDQSSLGVSALYGIWRARACSVLSPN